MGFITEKLRDWILGPVLFKLDEIKKEIHIMSVNQAQFDVLETAIGAAITAEDSILAKLLGLTQQILAKAQASGVDLTSEATGLQAITADVQTQTQKVQDAFTSINAALNPTTGA